MTAGPTPSPPDIPSKGSIKKHRPLGTVFFDGNVKISWLLPQERALGRALRNMEPLKERPLSFAALTPQASLLFLPGQVNMRGLQEPGENALVLSWMSWNEDGKTVGKDF